VLSELPATAEVVVVGAGCIGASIAAHLARAGMREVVLLEKGAPAAMTTGRSSAIVRQHYSQPTFARWAKESLSVWREFDAVFGVEAVFTRTGWAIAGGAADVEPMRECVKLLHDLGVHTWLVSADDLAALDPALSTSEFACAAYEPDAGYCDPTRAAAGFVTAFERLGGRALFGTRVVKLEQTGPAWRLETTAGNIESRWIVNAAGAYARWVAAHAGVDLPIEHYAHDIGIFETAPIHPRLAVYDMLGVTYYRPDGGDGLLAGSMSWSEGARVLDDPDAFPWLANPQVIARYARALEQRYPGAHPRLLASHAGIYFITPDRYPILGEAPEAPGLFLACGFSHGFKVSPAVGKAVAARLTEGQHASPELDEFRLTRFAEAQPIKPLYPYVSGIQT
jgi:sarcosine oxidase, subunit beta